MATFKLDNASGSAACEVKLCEGLTEEQLRSHKPFKQWYETLQANLRTQWQQSHAFYNSPYTLRSLEIQAVDRFGHDRIGFLKLKAEVKNDDGESLPGAVFLRGGSVAMLILLQPEDETNDEELHTILTIQPRIAAGSLAFSEIPAGMIDDSGSFSGAAAKEIAEETGLTVQESELINLSELASQLLGSARSSGESLKNGVYPSPGGCDEFIPIFLCKKKIERKKLEEMQAKLTGLRDEGEKITLKIVKAGDLWKEGSRDGKTLAAWALYQGLKGEGKI